MRKPHGSNRVALKPPSASRILTASLVGTAVEFYDFYIYATAAALVFGPLFFPSDNADLQLLLSFASFAVAFVARPIRRWCSAIMATGWAANPRSSLRCC